MVEYLLTNRLHSFTFVVYRQILEKIFLVLLDFKDPCLLFLGLILITAFVFTELDAYSRKYLAYTETLNYSTSFHLFSDLGIIHKFIINLEVEQAKIRELFSSYYYSFC